MLMRNTLHLLICDADFGNDPFWTNVILTIFQRYATDSTLSVDSLRR